MIDRRYRLGVGFALIGVGIVVAILGYQGVSTEVEVAFQLPYFASAGVGALLLFGSGAVLLLSTQLDRDAERLADIEEAVRLLAEEIRGLDEDISAQRNGRKTRSVPPRTVTDPGNSVRARKAER